MTIDANLRKFLTHIEWWEFEIGVGYVPTEQAPPEAREAMWNYNSCQPVGREVWNQYADKYKDEAQLVYNKMRNNRN